MTERPTRRGFLAACSAAAAALGLTAKVKSPESAKGGVEAADPNAHARVPILPRPDDVTFTAGTHTHHPGFSGGIYRVGGKTVDAHGREINEFGRLI